MGTLAFVDQDIALIELQRYFPGDVLGGLLDECQQGVHFRAEPEAVINQLGDFGRQPVSQVNKISIEGDLFKDQQGFVEYRHARCFVNAPAFHADETVFYHVDPSDAVTAGDGIELLYHLQWTERFPVDVCRSSRLKAYRNSVVYLL